MGTNVEIPESVKSSEARDAYALTNTVRADLKAVAKESLDLRNRVGAMIIDIDDRDAIVQKGEAIANATLAYRHLEDASMRLGKVLQALDGGVSVYDKATTVGA